MKKTSKSYLLHTQNKESTNGYFIVCLQAYCRIIFHYSYSYSAIRFCFERGHLLSCTAKGNYGKVDDYPSRLYVDLWSNGTERLPVPDWKCFRMIWETRVPNLRIQNSCEDTCPECFILKNKFKYLGRWRHGENEEDEPPVDNKTFVNDDE